MGAASRSGIIEILSRSGQVLQRIPYHGGHLSIGRAYDNDIIVGDPYVCPHHLAVRDQGGNLRIQDLQSLNGSYSGRRRRRFSEIEMTDRTLVHFGHSQLRFRAHGTPVSPAWRDISRHGFLALFDNAATPFLAGVLALVVVTLDNLLDTPGQPGAGELASQLLYPIIGVLVWSGFWSLINRIISHRSNFHVHLAIACGGFAAWFLLGQAFALFGFAMGWDPAVPWLIITSRIVLLAMAVYAHLRYATHGKPASQVIVASITALLLLGTPTVGEYLDRQEFSTIPYTDPLLKPPAFQFRTGVDVDEFFADSAVLRDRLAEEDD
jgi:hypothetical protein